MIDKQEPDAPAVRVPAPPPVVAASVSVATGDDDGAWPSRERAARPLAMGVIVAVGAIAAATLPLDRPGLGWLITGAAGLLGLGAVGFDAARGGGPMTYPRSRLVRIGWAALTLALLSVGALRAAGWLFTLCALAAALAAAQAVGKGRTTLGMLFAVTVIPPAMWRGIGWLAAGVERVRSERRAKTTLRTGAAVALSLLLVFVFGALFASADPAFARLVDAAVPSTDGIEVDRWLLLFPSAALLTLAAAFLIVNPTDLGDRSPRGSRPVRGIEWAMPVGALVSLFALYICVQATVLFRDERYVIRTAGLTFAQYARRGFWQLLVVTVLTLLILAVAARLAPRTEPRDRILLRALLGSLASLTLLIVLSALWRMWVYEEAYGFTRLRLTVSAFELWLGILFVMVLVAGVRLRAGWLPRAVVASGMIVLLGLAAINPDRFIASHNIERFERTGKIDIFYLQGLSADAALELDRLAPSLRACALQEIGRSLNSTPDDWTRFNAGRRAARGLNFPEAGPDSHPCWPAFRTPGTVTPPAGGPSTAPPTPTPPTGAGYSISSGRLSR